MGYPRKSLICLKDTPYYHVNARCVRRAWLCGYDAYAGKDYSHRKGWVLHRLRHLADSFAIDLCAYAIMENHYHLVLRVDRQRAMRWSDAEVAKRWTRLFRMPALIKRWRKGRASEAELVMVEELVEEWRGRLIDISWYMRSLNEYLARRANAEDGCTGRFWEGRFKSQALLDVEGLLTAMAYVDLNPVRAGTAETPEESEFTSIYARLQQIRQKAPQPRAREHSKSNAAPPLLAFSNSTDADRITIPMRLPDYLQLLDWTGRQRRPDKRGAIELDLPPILARLHIDPDAWLRTMRLGGNRFGRAIGRLENLRAHARRLGQSWIRGLQAARKLQPA